MAGEWPSPGPPGGIPITIPAQVAIYPLRQQRLGPAIDALTSAVRDRGLPVGVALRSTTVLGEADTLLGALRDGFARAAQAGRVVMSGAVSNACPVGR